MKILHLTFLFLFCSSVMQAQEKKIVNNFSVNEIGKIVWQKVFENPNINFDDIVSNIKSNKSYYDVETSEGKITFWIKTFETDPKASGFSRFNSFLYILANQKAFFTIEYKPGKYRISGVSFSNYPPSINLWSSKVDYFDTPLEDSALKNGLFTNEFIQKSSVILNDAVQKLFVFSKSINNNW